MRFPVRRVPARLVALCVAAAGCVLLWSVPAAVASRGVVGVFGGEGSSDGQFLEPTGLAVDQLSGDVYVVDERQDRVQVFEADGTYLTQFGSSGSAAGEMEGPWGLAIEQVTGNMYVQDAGNHRVDEFEADGKFLRAFGLNVGGAGVDVCTASCVAGSAGDAAGAFGSGGGPLAVDPSTGDVYVSDVENRRMDVFEGSGRFVHAFGWGVSNGASEFQVCTSTCQAGVRGSGVGQFENPSSIAVAASGEVYVAESGERVQRFGALPSNTPLGTFAPTTLTSGYHEGPQGVAVEPALGNVLVSRQTFVERNSRGYFEDLLYELDSAGEVLAVEGQGLDLPASELMAVGPGGEVYLANPFASLDQVIVVGSAPPPPTATIEAASGVTSGEATLHGTVDPNESAPDGPPVSYQFEYTITGAQWFTAPTPPGTVPSVMAPVPVSATITGLDANTSYIYRLHVERSFGGGSEFSGFEELTTAVHSPGISGVGFAEVGSAGATIEAQVSPENEASGYYVEYGPSVAYGSSTPEVGLPAASESFPVEVRLSGLQASSEYHFRIVARNVTGVTQGADDVFTTSGAANTTEALPDGRVYEMVTPPGNQNADVYVPDTNIVGSGGHEHGIATVMPFQAAADGEAMAYVGSPTSGGSGSSGDGGGNQYLATRSAGGGWTQTTLTPPHTRANFDRYGAFSANLTVGFIEEGAGEPVALSPGATPDGYNMLYESTFSEGAYRPFFTTKPPNRTREEFGAAGGAGGFDEVSKDGVGLPAYAGSSADLSHLLFEANDALSVSLPGGVSPVDGGMDENNLYDSVGGQLALVNVLPDGSTEPNATFGAPPFTGAADDQPDFSRVISADGSRIFWTALEGGAEPEEIGVPKALYVRENDAQPQSPLGPQGECAVSADACTVQVDASALPGTAKEKEEKGGGGRFWAASNYGSKVFFADCRRLTGDSTAVFVAGCQKDISENLTPVGNDLYEYDVSTGKLTDLTVDGNASDLLGADVQGVLGASEDGEYVYFVADGILANGAVGGQPNLYLSHGGVTTFIATLSPLDDRVLPTSSYGNGSFGDWQPSLGRRMAEVTPDGHSVVFMSEMSLTGYPNDGLREVFVYDAEGGQLSCVSCDQSGAPPPIAGDSSGVGEANGAAGYVPVSYGPTYQSRIISADGSRVFFNSPEPLVSSDTNGVEDVYEWEREGSGGCERSGGCVYLLSGGTSTDDSYLLDTSANGDDVFIATRAQLVPQDGDENFKLYDVRADGARALSPPECSGTGCQGVPESPPIFAAPASVTYEGVGNFATGSTEAAVKPKHKSKPKPKPKSKRKARKKHRGRAASGRGRTSKSSTGVSGSERRGGR